MGKIVHGISSWAVGVCAVALVVWVLLFAFYIVSRNFGLNLEFVEEVTGFWLVFIVYLTLAYALTTGVHVKLRFVDRYVAEKAAGIIKVFTDVIGLIIICYLLWRSIDWVIRGVEFQLHSETALHIILWPTFLPIPIGLTLFALALMVNIGKGVTALVQTKRV